MFSDPLAALALHRSDAAEAERRARILRADAERSPGASPTRRRLSAARVMMTR